MIDPDELDPHGMPLTCRAVSNQHSVISVCLCLWLVQTDVSSCPFSVMLLGVCDWSRPTSQVVHSLPCDHGTQLWVCIVHHVVVASFIEPCDLPCLVLTHNHTNDISVTSVTRIGKFVARDGKNWFYRFQNPPGKNSFAGKNCLSHLHILFVNKILLSAIKW